jgi:MarR family transcriptional regulator, transcriptional regulator for hemolysin
MERSDLHRNFGFLIHDVARLMRVAFDRRGRELGLTRSQWWVLTALYAKEAVTQSELAAFMDLEKATLGRLLDRLEEKEWIERRPDRHDRRIKRVYLTDRVQGLMRSLRSIAADIRRDATKGIEGERHEAFVDTLLQIKANLHDFDELRSPLAENGREAAGD